MGSRTAFVTGRVENVVGKKEENAGYQHFLFFPTTFSKGVFSRVIENTESFIKGFREENDPDLEIIGKGQILYTIQ